MSLSRPLRLLATLLFLGCGASERPAPSVSDATNERPEASVLDAPNGRLEAMAPGSTACPRFPEGTGAWTCTGPLWLEISEDHRTVPCETTKGVASTEMQARFNAAADCHVQVFGSDCRSSFVEMSRLHCVRPTDL